MRGLADPQTQERILEAAAAVEGGQLSLTRVLKIAEAHKMGKDSQSHVNSGGQLSRLSDYQAKKWNSRQETRKSKDDKPKDKNTKQCGNWGKSGHSSKLNDRRDHCTAFHKTCSKCNTNGHFAHMCRGGPRQTRNDRSKSKSKSNVNEVKSNTAAKPDEKSKDDAADLGTLTGSWFLLNGLQQPAEDADIYEDQDVFTSACLHKAQLRAINGNKRKIKHHVLNDFGQWKPSNVMPHGKLNINLRISQSAVQQLHLPPLHNVQHTTISALADTGAQMCVADWNIAKRLGLHKEDLFAPPFQSQLQTTIV